MLATSGRFPPRKGPKDYRAMNKGQRPQPPESRGTARPPKPAVDEGVPVSGVGTVERFTFRNPESGWAVIRLGMESGGQGVAPGPITAVGTLAQLAEGQRVRVEGKLTNHPRFGGQIAVASAEAVLPTTAEGVLAYLASGLVKGIGPAFATKIVDRFGTDSLRVIEEDPGQLAGIPGLGEKRVAELVEAVRAQKDIQAVMVFLRAHGLGLHLAARIVKRYGKNAAATIQNDPYRLADEVVGIGFTRADELAQSMGLDAASPERARAGIQHVLGKAAREGHCFLPEPMLAARTAALLGVDEQSTLDVIPDLVATGRVRRERPPGPTVQRESEPWSIYPVALFDDECGVARAIDKLVRHGQTPFDIQGEKALTWFEQRSGMQLPEGQRRAVLHALSESVSVITGGPGVGKTTIVRALVEIVRVKKLKIRLAAPTGRAAKRMEESTGQGATTLHRLLEYSAGTHRFTRNEGYPLEGDLLVIDEASMLDVQLAHHLVRAIPPTMKVVFIGDVDQLPAVGAGRVLDDLIESGRVPVCALNVVFRQAEGSTIVDAAHDVRRGLVPKQAPKQASTQSTAQPTAAADDGPQDGFFFMENDHPPDARVLIRKLVIERLPKAYGLNPFSDVQVLCPMYRGETGADSLNRDLQDHLNPGAVEVQRGTRVYRIGDKVMQVRNDHDADVYNGDSGRIASIDKSEATLQVTFGKRTLEYRFEDLDQLVPAYAITVHRAQGSEYPAVIVPISTEHFLMLRRNLLYTAMTRGRRVVVVVGSRRALELAVKNADENQRFSGLMERLREPNRIAVNAPERYAPKDRSGDAEHR